MKTESVVAEWQERIASAVRFLPDKPEETAESTIRALWLTASGTPVSAEAAMEATLPELDADQQHAFETLVQQRIDGVPLAHLTGRQRFMGIEMLAGPEALIPRKETEILAGCVVAHLQRIENAVDAPLVIDVCTGAGNLPVVYAQHTERSRIAAADLCPRAVSLAQRNVAFAGYDDRITVHEGDLLAPFDSADYLGRVDVLSCNPPYISSGKVPTLEAEIAEHEPSLAFDGGPFGISILQRLIQEAPRFLRPGGWLVFEVGLGQGEIMARRLRGNADFATVETHADAQGAIRAIAVQRSH